MTDPAPSPARKPLTLDQQADVLWYLLRRAGARECDEGLSLPTGDAWVKLDAELMKDLHAIWRTLRLFQVHGADHFVRDEITKLGQRRKNR